MKLNDKRDPALPLLGIGLLALIGGLFLVFFGSLNIFLLSWLASVAGPFMAMGGLWFIGYSIWQAITNSVHAGQRAIALRTLPAVPPAIDPAPELFDGNSVPNVYQDAPTMSSKALDHFENQSAVRTHIAYLNDIQVRAINALKPAPERYKADQIKVEAQQLVLYRMAHQAAVVARKVEGSFPKLKADFATVPQPKSIVLPTPPKLDTLSNFDQRQKNFTAATGRAIGQGINQGGAAGALVAIAASVAIGVIAFQKQVRAMEEAHGQLCTYVNGAIGDLELLGSAHAELVKISNELHRQSTELRALLQWAKEVDQSGQFRSGGTLDVQNREKVKDIMSYAMIARIDTSRAV